MISVFGLILALICFGTVGLAAAIALATWRGRAPHWLLPVARTVALLIAGACFLLASLHQIAEALTP
ncbi:hypothetical protein [Streptomyces sp. NPDC059753]|uniref:hypothetical protein n=1 Tax=Streptomyces sp. NPDC059753 TaxID=3346933 RepID=UPI0036659331